MDKRVHCLTHSFHDKITPLLFFIFLVSFKFYCVVPQGQRADTQGWEMDGFEMHDMEGTNNKQKELKKKNMASLLFL